MIVAFKDLQKVFSRVIGAMFGIMFFVGSLRTYQIYNMILAFVMGVAACISVLMLIADCREVKCLSWFAKYTMPILLMHTLFAASCRALLIKLGNTNAAIQVGLGIAISFVGPVMASTVLEKLKPLDFVIFPSKYIRLK